MLRENINKFSGFVTIILILSAGAGGCHFVSSNPLNSNDKNTAVESASPDYNPPQVVGKIRSPEIVESSGLVASRCQPNVLWTHNDSGDAEFVFAFDETGRRLGTYRVAGAKNDDWEDMATFKDANGECFLYLGDFGNNARERKEFTIYKVKEPKIAASGANSNKKTAIRTDPAEAVRFAYPDTRHDAETLIVHPQTGDIYILSKSISDASGIYKLPAKYDAGKTNRLEKISDFTVPAIPNGLLTGGSIAPDGKRVVLCDYFAAYEITLPPRAKNFDEIWKQKPARVELGERAQGEAISYSADGKSIFATSEKPNSPIIKVGRK